MRGRNPWETRAVQPLRTPDARFEGLADFPFVPRYLDLQNQSLAGIESVGNYALMFRWADGHDTGIWAFPRLRELCPCESCGGERLSL